MASSNPLNELARYNRWANAKVFAICRGVDEFALGAAAPGTISSVEETLKHLALVEDGYASMILGCDPSQGHASRESFLTSYLGHDLEGFADRVADVDREYERLTAEADPAFLDGELSIPWFAFPVTRGQGMLQVFSHSHTHRAQVMSTLGDRGLAVPDMDYVQMLQEERGAR